MTETKHPNKDEALKMAIDYMENMRPYTFPPPSLIQTCKDALAQQDSQEPIGTTAELVGSNGGFSMCVFESKNVPVGTKLFASPPKRER